MVVAIITGLGTIPLIKVPNKVKINTQYYIDFVLKSLCEEYLHKLYPWELQKVFIHHDAATSHTSKLTQEYVAIVKKNYGITVTKNANIPIKSSDVNSCNFFAFGHLKKQLKQRRPKKFEGLWKVYSSIWSRISQEQIRKIYFSWKRRLLLVIIVKGEHIEHIKKIYKKKLSN